MPFAPVKSDPFKKGKQKPRYVMRNRLWPDAFWRDLCTCSEGEAFVGFRDCVGPECRQLISDINERMYGRK